VKPEIIAPAEGFTEGGNETATDGSPKKYRKKDDM